MKNFPINCPYWAQLRISAKYVLLVMLVWSVCAPAFGLSDLRVKLEGPKSILAGANTVSEFAVVVYNVGNRSARGTVSSKQGYMVDLFMTKGAMPAGYARYSEKYFDGVLLKGGRVSNTRNIAAGKRAVYKTRASIPANTPAGTFQVCARVDPGRKLSEASESNNTNCYKLKVNRMQLVVPSNRWKALKVVPGNVRLRPVQPELVPPVLRPVEPPRPVGDSTAGRSVLEDGTLVIIYVDGSQRRLRPNGTTEFVSPQGQVMVPFAMQVQGAELPEMPEGLAQWGGTLADELASILGNILTENEMHAYQQTEAGKNYYEMVDWRLRSIRFLTAQESTQ